MPADYAAMSDAGITRAYAERVCGFAPRVYSEGRIEVQRDEGCAYRRFSPLTSDSDLFIGVDAMVAKSFSYVIAETPPVSSFCGYAAFEKSVYPPDVALPSSKAFREPILGNRRRGRDDRCAPGRGGGVDERRTVLHSRAWLDCGRNRRAREASDERKAE